MHAFENKFFLFSIIGHFTLIVIISVCFSRSWAGAEIIDRVVAEVNDDVITLSELEDEGHVMLKKIAREVPPSERDETLGKVRRNILTSLIDKTLIAQESAKIDVSVTEEEIDAAMARVMQANNLTKRELLLQLNESGLDETGYRDNLKSQILQNKLITREISSKVVITEEMILDVYDKKYTKQVDEGGYYLLQFGATWEKPDSSDKGKNKFKTREAALHLAERVHKLALSGRDFRDLAKRFSNLPSASEGGDIGVFKEDELARYMRDAVARLKPGEVSAIVETPVGFQFFKLLSSKEGGIVRQAPYESVKEEIRQQLFQKAMQEEYENWIQDLRDKAFVRIML